VRCDLSNPEAVAALLLKQMQGDKLEAANAAREGDGLETVYSAPLLGAHRRWNWRGFSRLRRAAHGAVARHRLRGSALVDATAFYEALIDIANIAKRKRRLN
jgi:hypothetical protein